MEQAPNFAYSEAKGLITSLKMDNQARSADLSPNGFGATLDTGSAASDDRRSEPRIETSSSVVMTPLAAVTIRIEGSIINVSDGGVRVRVDTQLKQLPRTGEVYRVQTQDDVMLCEVRNSEVAGVGAELGLQIVHWADAGKLKRLVKNSLRKHRSKVV
jgi:hypothetical protein